MFLVCLGAVDATGETEGCDGLGELNNITFPAIVQRVSTLADGGLRVTFDLPEDAILQAAELMAYKREEVALTVRVKMESGLAKVDNK